jgi:hypothetical protein
MPRKDNGEEENSEKKPNVTLPGTAEKIIAVIGDHIPEKAEIKIEGADGLCTPPDPACSARDFSRAHPSELYQLNEQPEPTSRPIPNAMISNPTTQPKSELKNAVVALAKKVSF